jgi:protein-disulfide isomerase
MAHLRVPVSSADHVQGAANAPITLVEYGDYECSFCGRAYPIIKKLQQRLGKRLRFVFRNFPIPDAHPHAMHAALAAEAVAALSGEGAFWTMHDTLYEHQNALDDAHLIRYASEAGADGAAVAQAVARGEYADRVEADIASGARSGVNGTPTFFINDERYDGEWTDIAAFAAAMEASLVR